MYIINRIVDYTARQKNLLTTEEGNIYHWKNGDIFYTVSGKGTPVILIHELNPASSAKEWSKIVHRLEKKHTVYTNRPAWLRSFLKTWVLPIPTSYTYS